MLFDIESTIGIEFGGKLGEFTSKRLIQIGKEEKLIVERLKDLRINVSKKLKEVSANGVFQS
jgi:hypothetical protein